MTLPEQEQGAPLVEELTDITPQDVEDFERLLPQLTSKPLPENSVIEERLRAAADPENPNSCMVVIRDDDGRIQATATGNICRIPTGEKAWVDDVIVDQSQRGKGYGGRVMDTLHEWFELRGVSSVNLTSAPARGAAGNLYERMGYNERNTRVYRKPLGRASLSSTVES